MHKHVRGGALCVGVCVCGLCIGLRLCVTEVACVFVCVWVCVTVCFANKLQKYFKGCHNHVALKSSLESATLSLPSHPAAAETGKWNERKETGTGQDKRRQDERAASSSTCLRICKIYRRHHYATISPAHTTTHHSPPLSFATPLKCLSTSFSLSLSLALSEATAAATCSDSSCCRCCCWHFCISRFTLAKSF